MASLSFHALEGLPEIVPGQSLSDVIANGVAAAQIAVGHHDVFVLAQKIVSKSEGRFVPLAGVTPSKRALEMAAQCRKDPRLVEIVLGESSEVLRLAPDVLIVRHKRGFVMANAGVDQSNVPGGGERVLLLPEDPDRSARELRAALEARFKRRLGVVINDSFGRPWRYGTSGVAIGAAGFAALLDLRGEPDRHGRALQVTEVAVADELAAGASLVMGQADEGRPVVIAKGLEARYFGAEGSVADLVRPLNEDLFR